MKAINHILTLCCIVLVGCDNRSLTGGRSSDSSNGTLPVADALDKEAAIQFKQGIGFYYYANGQTEMIFWPTPEREWNSGKPLPQLPPDTRFFAYGLDFSQGLMGTVRPPHQLGFDFTYVLPNGQKNATKWPAHFTPLRGYTEKVYEITFDGPLAQLKAGTLPYTSCVFRFGGGKMLAGHEEGFLFRYIAPPTKP